MTDQSGIMYHGGNTKRTGVILMDPVAQAQIDAQIAAGQLGPVCDVTETCAKLATSVATDSAGDTFTVCATHAASPTWSSIVSVDEYFGN